MGLNSKICHLEDLNISQVRDNLRSPLWVSSSSLASLKLPHAWSRRMTLYLGNPHTLLRDSERCLTFRQVWKAKCPVTVVKLYNHISPFFTMPPKAYWKCLLWIIVASMQVHCWFLVTDFFILTWAPQDKIFELREQAIVCFCQWFGITAKSYAHDLEVVLNVHQFC